MARPQTDIEAGRLLLLETAEGIIRDRGAVEIAMNELASVSGMSPSNVYRFFESKEDLFEAIAERWFAAKIAIMDSVLASTMPVRDKMLAFFGRRFALMVADYEADPELFQSYCELGNQHFETVRGYVDLADHYLALIVAEAMEQGYFPALSIDQTVSLINLMAQPFCNPDLIVKLGIRPTEEKLGYIIDAIFLGLGVAAVSEKAVQLKSVA
jgi:TetR/AcrR family transcriptional regulator, repressor of the ameABC operon